MATTVQQVKDAYFQITRTTLDDATAQATTTNINNGNQTFDDWVDHTTKLKSTMDTTGAVLKIFQFITGSAPDAASLTSAVQNITGINAAYSTSAGYTAFGADLATWSGSTQFQALYKNVSVTDFIISAFKDVFGVAPGDVQTQVNTYNIYKAYYGRYSISTDPSGDLRARGALMADYVHQANDIALRDNSTTFPWGVQNKYVLAEYNFEKDAVAGTAVYGGSLFTQPGFNNGQTYTLTTQPDNVPGTAGNDIINGVYYTDSIANSTYQATDTINGSSGTDTLNILVQKSDGTATGNVSLPIATVSGVEVFNIRALSPTAANTVTVDASQFPGVTTVNADRAISAVSVINLGSGGAVGMLGAAGVTNGNLSATYLASATAATLNIANGTTAGAITINGAGLTSATINSSGAANTVGGITFASGAVATVAIAAATNLTTGGITDTSGTITTLNVAGAATTVDLGTLSAHVATVDASGMTAGGVTTTLDAAISSFKGGQAADTVTTAAVTSTTAGIIDAGAGTDTLIIAATTDANTAAKAALYKNFEVLRLNASTTQDVSLFAGANTIASLQANASGAGFSKMTAAQAGVVTNLVDNAGATFALADASGGTDVLTVTLKNGTATASADLTGVTVDGFETVNVVSSSGTSADINQLSFASASTMTKLGLSGAAPIVVDTTNVTTAVTVDGTGLTFVPTAGNFDLTISGNLVKGSVVTGSAQSDSITTTAAIAGTTGDFVTYNSGAGDDSISSTIAAINNTGAGNGSLKIDGGLGTDTLTLTDAAPAMVDANFQYITNIEKLAFTGAGALNVVTGANFDTNFKTAGVTVTDTAIGANATTWTSSSFTGAETLTLTSAATTQAAAISTGSGNDTVTFSDSAQTSGTIAINTGTGADTISVTGGGANITTGTIAITPGTGQDTVTLAGNGVVGSDTAKFVSIVVHAGDSTLAAADSVNNLLLGNGANQGNVLDFDNAVTAQANAAGQPIAGYTNAQLTYTIAGGLFTVAGTSAAGLTLAQEAAIAVGALAADKAVVFTFGADSYVVEHNAGGDSMVRLVGMSATGLGAADVANGHVNVA
jgi:hypothetical protein